ncbi:hypothetical protein B9Z55_011035 [Caenorhabditis nigoni]|uniref:Homeobox domain-containing protein n=1 Tax=Caenorhabditis nigoni TaxID=1611254 RepID=A0A2G5UID5_9PELO|nr:hypothetical protein B9Z55_011035 [Caenorhabditis nigoni]
MEVPEYLQVPEDTGISPTGFMKNFKEPPKTKRTLRPHCKLTTQIFQAYFETSHHPSGLQMAQLAEITGLNNKQIKAWFSNISQPQEVYTQQAVKKYQPIQSPRRTPAPIQPIQVKPSQSIKQSRSQKQSSRVSHQAASALSPGHPAITKSPSSHSKPSPGSVGNPDHQVTREQQDGLSQQKKGWMIQ